MDKISLAGDLGSGKSTVSRILIERLGAEYYSTGTIVRSIAERMGMSIGEFNTYMETHPEIDNEIDDGLVRLGDDARLLIIDSRMAWHFTPGTFKVYLTVDLETSAIRIMMANRRGEHDASLKETVASTRARRESEQKRYYEQYGVDIKDLRNYSLVVDTTSATPEEIAECIISAFYEWQRDKSYSTALISPERLHFIDDEVDMMTVSDLSDTVDLGGEIPPVTAFVEDGEFYIESGTESALAYSLSMRELIPLTIIDGAKGDRKYVSMKNSL